VRHSDTEHANSFPIIFGAAATEHNAGKLESALELYSLATKLKPDFGQTYAMMALLHYSRN
jgi:hypothetical protein